MLTHEAIRALAVATICIGLISMGVAVGLHRNGWRNRRADLRPLLLCLIIGFLIGLGMKAAQWIVPSPRPASVRLELECAGAPTQALPRLDEGERAL